VFEVFVFIVPFTGSGNPLCRWVLRESGLRVAVFSQQAVDEMGVTRQPVHPAPYCGIRMRQPLDESQHGHFLQAPPDLAAVQLHGLGNGRETQPEIAAPAGMRGHEAIDALFLAAAVRMLEDRDGHKANSLPGLVLHAVIPFEKLAFKP